MSKDTREALAAALFDIAMYGDRGNAAKMRADIRACLMDAPAVPEQPAIEEIAQQWDGCIYKDAPGCGDIDIGEAIRTAGARLAATPAAVQQGREALTAFAEKCAGFAGGMVNGNKLSEAALAALAATPQAPQPTDLEPVIDEFDRGWKAGYKQGARNAFAASLLPAQAPAVPPEGYTWREDAKAFVRHNANGTDTVYNPLADIARELQVMLGSATEHNDGEWVTGYTIKTGALHKIIGFMQAAGYAISIPVGTASTSEPAPQAVKRDCTTCKHEETGGHQPPCNRCTIGFGPGGGHSDKWEAV
jgi:hypothetical protein